ncbi:MAG: LysM peptidoglycan-binding domain-containing protein [Christensenellales bacterium]
MKFLTVHRLRRKESVEALSALYHVPVCMIMRANDISDAREIGGNRTLVIPYTGLCGCGAKRKQNTVLYTVLPEDTLYGIAKKHDITMKLLMSANTLADPENIRQGDTLRIPKACGVLYSVREGETIDYIAQLYGMSASRLREKNGLREDEELKPGMRIILG